MPVLKPYVNDDGYYVHASVSTGDRPITLQTAPLAVELYRRAGYDPDSNADEGTEVPGTLTWAMYDVDLHWTKSGSQRLASDGGTTMGPRGQGPALTDDALEELESFCSSYDGASQEEVEELLRRLRNRSTSGTSSSGSASERSGLWSASERELDRYARGVAEEIHDHFVGNDGFDIRVRVVPIEKEGEPRVTRVDVLLTDSDDGRQYLHQVSVCEEHGLGRCSTRTDGLDWSERLDVETQRTVVLHGLVRVADRHGLDIGDPSGAFRARVENSSINLG